MTQTGDRHLDPAVDYPLSSRRPDLLHTPTGKHIEDLTLDAVVAGDLSPLDLRIAPDTLLMQAEIADGAGRWQLAENFRRAAEMTEIPDERVLAMYNALRPNASSGQELADLADELEREYSAGRTAALVREAADVYGRRNLLAAADD
ncbi:diol dehydratase small subunit [Actinomycetospora cinnamomea]|uniref:Propanediol dehydratase small subunit n=1 Tax=Actinomycetospora cinnamomea TaxID=663609 RepID=A0A2U1FL60_9PSEU|nr:diol dehydratase small subunit [Actinomycetospora cinnamomea]PVZ12908.1 propanediol dehydratase small subunit [Actinomycetospora cinnamomea]